MQNLESIRYKFSGTYYKEKEFQFKLPVMNLIEGPSYKFYGMSINVATEKAVLNDTNMLKLNM